MRRAAGLALALMLAAPSVFAQPGPGGPERMRRSYANPSAVIAADLGLSRIAREKGQWRALRDAAGPGAVVFAPRPVDAVAWLKRHDDSPASTRWQPRAVWISCDGGHAVSRGQWTRGSESGDYVAVWERQKKGEWKWLVRDEGPPTDLGEAPEMIAAQVAECSGLPRRRPGDEVVVRDAADALSDDRSLRWSVQLAPDCARILSVAVWDGKALVPVVTARRGAPAGGCG
jgi:hypothetical protein